MDGSRVRRLLIIMVALSVGASLWLLPRAASFITPSPPTPIELQAVPTPAADRGAAGDSPDARVAEPGPGADDDDRGGSGAAVGDTDDADDRGGDDDGSGGDDMNDDDSQRGGDTDDADDRADDDTVDDGDAGDDD